MGVRYRRRDPFYLRAKKEGYRSRAAYKLLDLVRRAPRVRRGARVLELGCWPGGWLQVLCREVGAEGRVVGVDIEEIEPLPGVVFVHGDFSEPRVVERIAAALGGAADAVLSDAAPKLTGVREVDRAAQEELCLAALAVAERVLRPDGALILKGFPGPEADRFRARLRERFAAVAETRPQGKRASSKEFYWIAGPEREEKRRRARARKPA